VGIVHDARRGLDDRFNSIRCFPVRDWGRLFLLLVICGVIDLLSRELAERASQLALKSPLNERVSKPIAHGLDLFQACVSIRGFI